MTQDQMQEKSGELQKEILELQKKYGVELYAANVAIGTTVGSQEVIPMIKFRFIEKPEVKEDVLEWDVIKK